MKVSKRVFKRSLLLAIMAIIVLWKTVGFSDAPNVFVLRVIATAILLYCLIKGVKNRDILNPYIYFALVPFSLVIFTHSISSVYYVPLKASTWFLGIINMLAYVVILSLVMNKKQLIEKNELIIQKAYEPTFDEIKSLQFHSIVLMCIGQFELILKLTTGIRFFLGTVTSYCIFPAIAMAWKTKKTGFILGTYAVLLLTWTVQFNKSVFLAIALITIIAIRRYYPMNKKNSRKLYIAIGIMGLFFIFVAFPLKGLVQDQSNFSIESFVTAIKDYYYNKNDYYAKSIDWNGLPALRFPYIYLTSAWNNVQYVLETQNTRTYGLWMLKPLISWLQLDGYFADLYVLTPRSSFNTFTYITVLFKDFGYWGSMIGSCFLGWFVGRIYNNYRKTYSAYHVAMYAVVSQAAIEMFFSNHFFGLFYPFTILIICWCYRRLFKSARYL